MKKELKIGQEIFNRAGVSFKIGEIYENGYKLLLNDWDAATGNTEWIIKKEDIDKYFIKEYV